MSRILACLLPLALIGCDSGGKKVPLPDTVPVSGVVTLDGNPLESATVTFIPTGTTKGVDCMGVTDKEGKYKLKQLRGKDGAPQGTYRVTVSQLKQGGNVVAPTAGGAVDVSKGVATEALPPRYSSPGESKLEASVGTSGGEFKFELKSK